MSTILVTATIGIVVVLISSSIVVVDGACTALQNDFVFTGSVTDTAAAKYNFTFDTQKSFMLFAINTTALNVVARHAMGGGGAAAVLASSRQPADSSQCEYMILKPTVVASTCAGVCTFEVSVIAPTSTEVWFELSGYYGTMMQYGVVYHRNLTLLRRHYFGLEITTKDLDVYVRVEPDATQDWMDLDLFSMFETTPFTQFRPNSASRNHYRNIPEELVVTGKERMYTEGLLISDVLAPDDSRFAVNYFSILATKNYVDQEVLNFSFFGVVGALMVLVLCLFTAAAVVARRRRENAALLDGGFAGDNGIIMYGQPRVRRGVSTREIARFTTIVKYAQNASADADTRCTICLVDYDDTTQLRELRCKHSFHIECIDEWLKHHRECPLCQQDVASAFDVHVTPTPSPLMVPNSAPMPIISPLSLSDDDDDDAQDIPQRVPNADAAMDRDR